MTVMPRSAAPSELDRRGAELDADAAALARTAEEIGWPDVAGGHGDEPGRWRRAALLADAVDTGT